MENIETLEKTKRFWGESYRKPLSDDEAREIMANLNRYFALLNKLDESFKEEIQRFTEVDNSSVNGRTG